MRIIFVCIIAIAFVGCVQEAENMPSGGYKYPDKLSNIDEDDYSHPIRDLISTKDSFDFAYYEKFFFRSLDEPNLSIKPIGETRFRLTYRSAFGDAAIVTIFKNRIEAKQLLEGDPFPVYDSTRLNPLERRFYEILDANFPLQAGIDEGHNFLDSIVKTHPQLLDANFYKYLLDKCLVPNANRVSYTLKKFSLPTREYFNLVRRINSIGYWSMPNEIPCQEFSTDGFSVTLEANTASRYNLVYRLACTNEEIPFLELCQEIVDLVKFKIPVHIISRK